MTCAWLALGKLTRRYDSVTLCLDGPVGIIAESTLRSPIEQPANALTSVRTGT
jgi:hypothetical protein